MSTELQIYWLTRLPVLGEAFMVISVFGTIASILVICAWFTHDPQQYTPKFKDYFITIAVLLGTIFSGAGAILTPNKEELAIILAGSYLAKSELPTKMEAAISKYLDGYLDTPTEITPSKKK